MADFRVLEYDEYEDFAREWDGPEEDVFLRWQLLGELDPDEVLVVLPEWLAEESAGFVDGAVPTEFVGRIERETEKAIRLADATAAGPLMRLAHRIRNLEQGVETAGDDVDRRAWLKRRLEEKRRAFDDREAMTGLRDAWLPKSQLARVVRRTAADGRS